MSHNSFGHSLRLTTWGESHGPAIGGVLDGMPPQIPLTEEIIQPFLDRRKPGNSPWTSRRAEDDVVRILSGTFEGKTTGTPVALVIENQDARSKDYDDIRTLFRPGHADVSYHAKYGVRDHRGSGRASARETAVRVAAGAAALAVLKDPQHGPPGFQGICGGMIAMGADAIEDDTRHWDEVNNNPFFCPDPQAAQRWEKQLAGIRKAGSSIGAVLEIIARGVPAGLGAPLYGKLDQDLGAAMLSINAVKGVEIGAGFRAAALRGEDNADAITLDGFLSNNAGGILGGISTGQEIVVRFAVKPTSSILVPQPTVDTQGQPQTVITRGRHDPCVGIRAVPVGEAMMALVLADHWLRHRGQVGGLSPDMDQGRP